MDKNEILRKLQSKKPLFEQVPRTSWKAIGGTESEYGSFTKDVDRSRLPVFTTNGGLVYIDCDHLEYASPETSNALEALMYYEAGKVLCWQENFTRPLYCHNTDWEGNTFGAHESYFTNAPRYRWEKLLPFLIARVIICGNGWFNKEGKFVISQRAQYIERASSEETKLRRGVINLRHEPLGKAGDYDERLHLICRDANMSEVSTFLCVGITALILELLEKNALPEVSYDSDKSATDILQISKRTSGWFLVGIKGSERGAVELLSCYLERAKSIFSKRDSVTDALLIIWEDTLEKLARNPMELSERLDWVAKLKLLNLFQENVGDECTANWLCSQDMEYHNLDPEKGLYYWLRDNFQMERIISDEMILYATEEPPKDTRAYVRGKLAQHLLERGGECLLGVNSWDNLNVYSKSGGIARKS